ncbi:DoxX family protein [Mycobacterium sp. 94-17]|uniref:DoxX family protein n=1 Tax=Mycobacterium sp. 94-17 TaxID=2986147 RepID=UPI002D1E9071|nr:DoxX family protein [Mycobacterium sp. 94-17]MEB4209298.1 DoxX family protein [Mycobacterium sp. 94-17]
MNAALWAAQIVLAGAFALSGTAKITLSRQRLLDTGQTGVAMFPMPVVRFTAASEILAAVGLIAPGLTGLGLIWTPLAAAGLCVVMIGAAWAHTRLHEPRAVAVNIVLFGLALFVALCRAALLH